MQVSTLGSYESVTVAKLKIFILSVHQRKKGRSYFKNGGKAHDAVVITRKYSKFLNSGRVNNVVHVYVVIQRYILEERYL